MFHKQSVAKEMKVRLTHFAFQMPHCFWSYCKGDHLHFLHLNKTKYISLGNNYTPESTSKTNIQKIRIFHNQMINKSIKVHIAFYLNSLHDTVEFL